jgi:hypothetical protein
MVSRVTAATRRSRTATGTFVVEKAKQAGRVSLLASGV